MTRYELDKLRVVITGLYDAGTSKDLKQRYADAFAWLDTVEPEDILEEIDSECARQSELWGDLHDDGHGVLDWGRLIVKYVAKSNDAIDEQGDVEEWRGRMVQIAAIAVSAIRSFDRINYKGRRG